MLAGLAGAGKTELLSQLAATGEQTLDLEGLADHSGSAFGHLGRAPQPSHERFQLLVARALAATDPARPLFVEDEGPFIGSVGLPLSLLGALQAAPFVWLAAPFEHRVERLLAEYGSHEPRRLAAPLVQLSGRLGAERSRRACSAILAGRLAEAVEIVLPYYDAAYSHRVSLMPRTPLGAVDPRDVCHVDAVRALVASVT